MKVKCEFCEEEFETSDPYRGDCSLRCEIMTWSEIYKGFVQSDYVYYSKEREDELRSK